MEYKEKNFISAVVYVHNAADRVEGFLEAVIRILESKFEHSEIICVNDASDDDSMEAIKRASQKAGNVSISVIHMSYFHGLELAMNAGVDLSIGDFVFEFDHTILDFDTDVVMEVYRRSLEGFDIVSASADKKEKMASRLFYRIFDRFANLSYKMSTERFRILSRRSVNRISSMNKAILYRKALYANCGLKMDHIKYAVKDVTDKNPDRYSDEREHNYRLGLAVDSLIVFTEIGYKFSMAMTMLMMATSLFVIAYTIIAYMTLHPVAGWTTTILFLAVSFFGLFGIQTIIVKYLQLLVNMVFKRKHYSFENIEKLTK